MQRAQVLLFLLAVCAAIVSTNAQSATTPTTDSSTCDNYWSCTHDGELFPRNWTLCGIGAILLFVMMLVWRDR
jgi:hypothetical protein